MKFRESDFERATPHQIRRAAMKCKKRTARHPGDAMGMRQTLLLPDEALLGLAALFEITEGTGELPLQAQLLIVKLLDKPKGGKRPVGFTPGTTDCGPERGKARQQGGKQRK